MIPLSIDLIVVVFLAIDVGLALIRLPLSALLLLLLPPFLSASGSALDTTYSAFLRNSRLFLISLLEHLSSYCCCQIVI